MSKKINIRGVYFDDLSREETVSLLVSRLEKGQQTALFTPNPEIVQLCVEDNDLYKIINSGDVVIPDGVGVIMAGKVLKTPFKGRSVPGIEVGENVIKYLSDNKKSIGVYLLGGKPGIAEKARDELLKKYPNTNFVGCGNGYFKKEGEESDAVVKSVNESGAEVLFVCLGAPTQEKWIYANRDKLTNVKLMLALGGSLDGYSGTVKRAPKIFIKLGLEWFYRLVCEPWRIKRMIKLPVFYFGTWKYRLTGQQK